MALQSGPAQLAVNPRGSGRLDPNGAPIRPGSAGSEPARGREGWTGRRFHQALGVRNSPPPHASRDRAFVDLVGFGRSEDEGAQFERGLAGSSSGRRAAAGGWWRSGRCSGSSLVPLDELEEVRIGIGAAAPIGGLDIDHRLDEVADPGVIRVSQQPFAFDS